MTVTEVRPNITIDERFNLKGKVAVVVGGAGFLCSSLAKAMADSAMKVNIIDLKKPDLPFGEVPYPVKTFACNVTSPKEIHKVHYQIVREYGRVDVLINGAGVNAPTPFFDISEKEIDAIFASHLKATLFSCQIFGKTMISQKRGSIINFSSVSMGPPLSKAFVYSVSKAGVANLTQNLGREWAPYNVRVNALRPGFFPTEWSMKNFIDEDRKRKILGHTPMNRFGKPEELIGAVLWLASDAASFVTGSIVTVDGGYTAMTI